jgi:hypothetical protein
MTDDVYRTVLDEFASDLMPMESNYSGGIGNVLDPSPFETVFSCGILTDAGDIDHCEEPSKHAQFCHGFMVCHSNQSPSSCPQGSSFSLRPKKPVWCLYGCVPDSSVQLVRGLISSTVLLFFAVVTLLLPKWPCPSLLSFLSSYLASLPNTELVSGCTFDPSLSGLPMALCLGTGKGRAHQAQASLHAAVDPLDFCLARQ